MPENTTIISVLEQIKIAITSAVSVTDLVGVIVAIVCAGIGFSLIWFGGRKAVRALHSAITKGKIKV